MALKGEKPTTWKRRLDAECIWAKTSLNPEGVSHKVSGKLRYYDCEEKIKDREYLRRGREGLPVEIKFEPDELSEQYKLWRPVPVFGLDAGQIGMYRVSKGETIESAPGYGWPLGEKSPYQASLYEEALGFHMALGRAKDATDEALIKRRSPSYDWTDRMARSVTGSMKRMIMRSQTRSARMILLPARTGVSMACGPILKGGNPDGRLWNLNPDCYKI